MQRLGLLAACVLAHATLHTPVSLQAGSTERGLAAWYGEAHRGKTMANGQKFDPEQRTAASWSYPLGTRVRVTLESEGREARSVIVTITDRGPAPKWVKQGRIIDLSKAAFKELAPPEVGLVAVAVQPVSP